MYHPATGDLQPILAHLASERVGKIDFKAWLGVAEVMRAKTYLCFGPHQLAENKFHRALEIGHSDALVHVQSFNLVKGGIMRGIGGVTAIHAARHNDAHRRLLLLHHTNLHTGSVRSQQRPTISGDVKSILCIAGRMISGCVEGIETVIFILHLRTIGNHKAKLAKALDDILSSLSKRMELAE